jgi:ribosomal protein S18 acetylase RimI-like enzyme
VTPSHPSSKSAAGNRPQSQTSAMIRRAGMGGIAAVWDQVHSLAEASATAAQWSRAAFYPYLVPETEGGGLQAKTLFVAFVGTAKGISPASPEGLDSVTEQIIGFAAFSAIMSLGTGECMLENMAVAKTWQRQGIGGRLLAAGMLWCRAHAARNVFLEVRETNQAAIALYERAGFLVVGRRPDYYGGPVEAALQMQKLIVPVA